MRPIRLVRNNFRVTRVYLLENVYSCLMLNRILLIIDPQVDFIDGALAVAGAREAMDALASYVDAFGNSYSHIIVTADRHPPCHCSFVGAGGRWPRHCVADSVGAAVWPRLMESLYAHVPEVIIVHKGENPLKEEYSPFGNAEAATVIADTIRRDNASEVDVCGLAGDFCVANALRDAVAMFPAVEFRVLRRFTPSIDGGAVLDSIIDKYSLPCDR